MNNRYNFESSLCACGATIPHTCIHTVMGIPIRVTHCPACILEEQFRSRHTLPLPVKAREKRPIKGSAAWYRELEELREAYGHYERKEDGKYAES